MTVTNPYEELALVLDTIPNGYPAVEDGTHLRVLEWIFTPEEAELCRKLKLKAETSETIAIRLERPPDEIETLLETMHSKGQIRAWMSKSKGARIYGLMPFAVGIYEEQLDRMDEEFAKLLEGYLQQAFKKITAVEPVIFQVLPVNQSINAVLVYVVQNWYMRFLYCYNPHAVLLLKV